MRIPGARVRIAFNDDVPREIRAAVEKHVKRWLPRVAPRWCTHMRVIWSDRPNDPSCSTSASADDEYGYGRIFIHPGFLEQSEDQRESDIVHELVHLTTHPMHEAHRMAVAHLVPEDQRAFVREVWVKAMEQSVVDITAALLRTHGATR